MPRRPTSHPIRLQPQRRPPERRLHEHRFLEPIAGVSALLPQKSRPAERAQHLDVELAHHLVVARERFLLGLAEEHAAEVGSGGAVLRLDVQDVQEHAPVAKDRCVLEARHAGVVDPEQKERDDRSEDPTGMAN